MLWKFRFTKTLNYNIFYWRHRIFRVRVIQFDNLEAERVINRRLYVEKFCYLLLIFYILVIVIGWYFTWLFREWQDPVQSLNMIIPFQPDPVSGTHFVLEVMLLVYICNIYMKTKKQDFISVFRIFSYNSICHSVC